MRSDGVAEFVDAYCDRKVLIRTLGDCFVAVSAASRNDRWVVIESRSKCGGVAIPRRSVHWAVRGAATIACVAAGGVCAQTYPVKPLRMKVPFAPAAARMSLPYSIEAARMRRIIGGETAFRLYFT